MSKSVSVMFGKTSWAFQTHWEHIIFHVKNNGWGFPGGTVVGSLPAGAGDTDSSPGLGGSHMPRSN